MTQPLRSILRDHGFRLADVARAMGKSRPCLSHWNRNGIPAKHVLEFERLTGVSRHVLRPDLYPLPQRRVG